MLLIPCSSSTVLVILFHFKHFKMLAIDLKLQQCLKRSDKCHTFHFSSSFLLWFSIYISISIILTPFLHCPNKQDSVSQTDRWDLLICIQLYLSPNRQVPVLEKNIQVSRSVPGIRVTIGLCHGSSYKKYKHWDIYKSVMITSLYEIKI